MEGRRAPQGIDAEDKLALGLSAPHLFYLVTFSMAGWALLSSHLPALVRIPPGILLLMAGAALAWGRLHGRPLDRWAYLALAYLARPRHSPRADTVDASCPVAAAAPPPDPPGQPVARLGVEPPREHAGTHVVGFFSLRGGTGKSTLAAECAAMLAGQRRDDGARRRVLLVDLDCAASSMHIRLGLQHRHQDDDTRPGTIDHALHPHESGLRLVSAGDMGDAKAGRPDGRESPGDGFATILRDAARASVDHVIVDLPREARHDSGVLEHLDDIIYVFEPNTVGVYDLYRGVATLRRMGHRERVRCVANRVHAAHDLGEVIADLRVPFLAPVPWIAAIETAADMHRPAAMTDECAASALRPLVTWLSGRAAQEIHEGAHAAGVLAAG